MLAADQITRDELLYDISAQQGILGLGPHSTMWQSFINQANDNKVYFSVNMGASTNTVTLGYFSEGYTNVNETEKVNLQLSPQLFSNISFGQIIMSTSEQTQFFGPASSDTLEFNLNI